MLMVQTEDVNLAESLCRALIKVPSIRTIHRESLPRAAWVSDTMSQLKLLCTATSAFPA